jgi:hypothetical protein
MNDDTESKEKIPGLEDLDREPVFYYSREARLARAPKRVREFYENVPVKKKFAFFTCLADTKPKAMSLLTIIVLCVVIFILKFLK